MCEVATADRKKRCHDHCQIIKLFDPQTTERAVTARSFKDRRMLALPRISFYWGIPVTRHALGHGSTTATSPKGGAAAHLGATFRPLEITLGLPWIYCEVFCIALKKSSLSSQWRNQRRTTSLTVESNQAGSTPENWRTNGKIKRSFTPGASPSIKAVFCKCEAKGSIKANMAALQAPMGSWSGNREAYLYRSNCRLNSPSVRRSKSVACDSPQDRNQ